VGVSSVPVPMLTEDRTLVHVALQRKIEEEFGMKLGSDGSGKSVNASLEKCLIADCKFAERMGFLKTLEECINELVQTFNGAPLRWQVRMDACRNWKNTQQTSLGYIYSMSCPWHHHILNDVVVSIMTLGHLTIR
jgi:hypothetical protein